MVDGPRRPVSGVVRPYRTVDGPEYYYFGTYGTDPTVLRLPPEGVRLTRAGRGFRVESLAGELLLCGEDETVWDFRDDPQRPHQVGRHNFRVLGPGSHLVITRDAGRWVGDRLTRPAGAVSDVEFLGRACWSVTLDGGSPTRSRRLPDLRIIVDADTGAVLAEHSGDGVDGAAYTDLAVADTLDPALFCWEGLVAPMTEAVVSEQERNADWFREHITAEPLELPIIHDLSPGGADIHDAEAGEFTVFLGRLRGQGGMATISRRLRSTEPWPISTGQFQVVWSTPEFDWSVCVPVGRLDNDAVVRLQEWLHMDIAAQAGPPTTKMRYQEY